jgi:CDP-paratose 2-epimerase
LEQDVKIFGIDNLSRRGSETNLPVLKHLGVEFTHGDIRLASDLDSLPDADWVVDCAANPSVTAGVVPGGNSSPAQLIEHNLLGTVNILEYCRKRNSGLVLLSTNRVYSIRDLQKIKLKETPTRFEPVTENQVRIPGLTSKGIAEEFPTCSPVSLYGATKLSSESLALEYSEIFGFPVWVNRCSIIGGPGQFGRPDQGILAFWVYSLALNRPLSYIGWGGKGKQVRDCITAEDLASLVSKQIKAPKRDVQRIVNVGGGLKGSISLIEITDICSQYNGRSFNILQNKTNRPYDIPYYVTDNTCVEKIWGWSPGKSAVDIVNDLCNWTAKNIDFVKAIM